MAYPRHLAPTDYTATHATRPLVFPPTGRIFLSPDNHTHYNWDKTGNTHAEKIFSWARDQKKKSAGISESETKKAKQ